MMMTWQSLFRDPTHPHLGPGSVSAKRILVPLSLAIRDCGTITFPACIRFYVLVLVFLPTLSIYYYASSSYNN